MVNGDTSTVHLDNLVRLDDDGLEQAMRNRLHSLSSVGPPIERRGNEEYGFEMRYPKWWNVYELNERILFKDAPLEDIPDEWFSVNIKNNEYDFSNYDFSKEKMVDKITGKEEINISDIKGFRYTFYPKSEIYILTKYIILNYKGQGWALSYGYDLSQELENQMLSTFRFLK